MCVKLKGLIGENFAVFYESSFCKEIFHEICVSAVTIRSKVKYFFSSDHGGIKLCEVS